MFNKVEYNKLMDMKRTYIVCKSCGTTYYYCEDEFKCTCNNKVNDNFLFMETTNNKVDNLDKIELNDICISL